MPTVSVNRDLLFAALEETFTEETFDELCFDFGIELDEVTTAEKIVRKEKHLAEEPEAAENEETIYKIDVPANRYDLLCLEGIARGLRIFKGKEEVPTFNLTVVASPDLQKLTVKPETSLIRPYIVAAILRGVTFNQARYDSFIDLQDKLHQNICRVMWRGVAEISVHFSGSHCDVSTEYPLTSLGGYFGKRTLVAIGTHDLDTLRGPFTYEALSPSKIKFVPLKQTKEFTAKELMEFYKGDLKLKKFLPIIESSPVYPVIYDKNRTVLSLPPIINGAHSAITLETKNVFIECTGTDLTKAKIVLNTMVTMFSQYCARRFEVEPVEVIHEGKSVLYPDLSLRKMEVEVSYINGTIGVNLPSEEIAGYLYSMQLATEVTKTSANAKVTVTVPPTRSDVLHPCDVVEDVAIAFGYNNIEKTVPGAHTLGKQQDLNHFTDLLRQEVALAGFTEILSWILGSNVENFSMLNREEDKRKAVAVGNPRTSEFEVVRTSLLPGMLKTMAHNKKTPRPVKLFEVSDVVLLDSNVDVGASNQRHICALFCDQTSGFEVIHGLVDRVMTVVGVSRSGDGEKNGYYIKPSNEPEYFTGRQASIIYNGNAIGSFGIIHPEVLERFDIPDPCTAMEFNIEPFL